MKTDAATAKMSISDEDFRTFREYFYRKTGIHFEDSKRYFVDKRLMERIAATDSKSFRGYFIMLRLETSGVELQALVNLMTVNETYFFREEYQFQCMVTSLLKEITQHKKDNRFPIRIWSIPSSSGEEAYSIVIYLLEYWPGIHDWDVEIISSDIDTNIISRAQLGHYSPRSVQHLPPHLLDKYFTMSAGNYQINDDINQSVEFTRVNLMNLADVRAYRGFDIVFCRNLLIYFDELSRRQAADTFFDALNPGGFVCLGHSESMSRTSSLFRVRKFPEAIVYQKPLEDA
ncbi:protein-glutamate O-methyltransferase CheR [Candidatus Methylospira mobilis]|uniref:Chemotaxis protein methyltransferase n=1 Tax=Candidatus Methylospira mobilis TaxID=1808979 RepID=A0A5Q0BMD4_9GAMM|nr:protein-glutamate O-methyltransferase CheR [Candidatus Methylospira mobilis]QFY42896.1 protein-glutamate O-methyltransferase CheR [Candidatus Methylospira mobilis]WNV04045.1 protein-glutamate O-methyltransferase CheR [Candidatus Methylospira mobilis]